MTEKEIAWITGLFEGEGCIHIRKGKYVHLTVSMTDKDVLERFFSIVGVGTFAERPRVGTNKIVFSWSVGSAKEVRHLLVAMLPLLGERRSLKAIEAIGYADHLLSRVREIECICGQIFVPANAHVASRKKFCSKSCMQRTMMERYKKRHRVLS